MRHSKIKTHGNISIIGYTYDIISLIERLFVLSHTVCMCARLGRLSCWGEDVQIGLCSLKHFLLCSITLLCRTNRKRLLHVF
jgi:hypothetical protein